MRVTVALAADFPSSAPVRVQIDSDACVHSTARMEPITATFTSLQPLIHQTQSTAVAVQPLIRQGPELLLNVTS